MTTVTEVVAPRPLQPTYLDGGKRGRTVSVHLTPGRPGGASGGGLPVVCRQGPVLVTAFHPELTGDRRLHRLFVGMTKETR